MNHEMMNTYTQNNPQGLYTPVGVAGDSVTEVYASRGWDLILLVKSVTWLNRDRRSAIN